LPASERYVFRALAAKLILSEPERYGFEVPHEQRYRPYDDDVVEIELRDRISVTELAWQARSFYRELKALNPEIVETHSTRVATRLACRRGTLRFSARRSLARSV
jgi:membrane-bound lytic murein transglycosylase D